MNHLRERGLGLVGALLGVFVFLGLFVAPAIYAQSDSPVTLTAEPSNLPVEPGTEVRVIITYNVTESTKLFYYPPVGFEYVSKGNGSDDPDDAPSPGFNGAQRISWDVEGSGRKEVVLRVTADAQPGIQSHHAVLEGGPAIDGTITLVAAPTTGPTQDTAPNLQIITATVDRPWVEPGEPFSVTIIVRNEGDVSADNVSLAFGAEVEAFSNLITDVVGFMEAGDTLTKSYQIGTLATLTDSNYPFFVELLNGEVNYYTETITVTVKQLPQTPNVQLTSQTVEPIGEGVAKLIFAFANDGRALPDGAKLVLRYNPADSLQVQQATLNGQPQIGEPQADGGSYAWANLPPFDWENEVTLEIAIDLQVPPDFSVNSAVSVSFINSDGGFIGEWFDLSAENIVKLFESAAPEPTVTPTEIPEPTNTPEPDLMVSESGEADVEQEMEEVGGLEDDGAGAEEEPQGLTGLQLGLMVGGGLLLFLLVALLIVRGRKQASAGGATPPAQQPVRTWGNTAVLPPTPPAAQRPYFCSSDGRIFYIDDFPFHIGRGENNQLVIDDTFGQWETVSRQHAVIDRHPQQGLFIADAGSQNGIKVSGRQTPSNLLRNGWQVHIGGVAFTFFDGTDLQGGAT